MFLQVKKNNKKKQPSTIIFDEEALSVHIKIQDIVFGLIKILDSKYGLSRILTFSDESFL